MATPDYSGSTWYGAYSGNYTSATRPSSNSINKIVVHVTQGSWSSAINWFKDSRAGVSAHYTVRSSDGIIGQSVQEKDIAYHAGYWPYNQTSIGIEHEGYVSDPKWFTEAMYRSSAKLSAYLCKKYNIPIDRSHIIGHNEVPNATHTDPGGNWNWTKYMSYVREAAGATTSAVSPVTPAPTTTPVSSSTYSMVVDNKTTGRFFASSNWKLGNFHSQRYGADFRYTTPKAVSDLATFKVKIPTTGQYDVFVWWPAHSSYNGAAPIQIQTTTGIKTLKLNQRISGAKWVYLGAFGLGAGDGGYVRMSRWTSSSGPIFADAVKVVRR